MDETVRTAAQRVIVPPDRAAQRLDNFLLLHFKTLPKSRVYRLIRKGEVRVNGGRVDVHYRLQADDEVRIPPVWLPVSSEAQAQRYSDRLLAFMQDQILYEDEALIVVDKPVGLSVHRGSGVDYGVIDLIKALREAEGSTDFSLVHRLDRDTSGCLLNAKNYGAAKVLHEQFRAGSVAKHYQALLAGVWKGAKTWRETVALEKGVVHNQERMVVTSDSEDAKDAETIFTLSEQLDDAFYVDITLITGRTHQIRVHAAHCRHPVVGDQKYGDKSVNRHFRTLGIKRLCLHAYHVEFDHPIDKRRLSIKARPLSQLLAEADE